VATPDRSFEKVEGTLEKLWVENRRAIGAILKWNVAPRDNLRLSHYKLKEQYKRTAPEHQLELKALLDEEPLLYNNKQVANAAVVLEQVGEWLDSGHVQKTNCGLCCTDYRNENLEAPCGRKRCARQTCASCLQAWYSQVKVGEIVFMNHLLCPFCKTTPSTKVMTKYNPVALRLTKVAGQLDASMYHGWCKLCDAIKPIIARDCARDVPVIQNFTCDDCKFKSAKDFVGKNCPRCAHPTVKLSGCNHMTCVCKAHWCFACGEEFTAATIYTHMTQKHGGYGFDAMYESDGEEDDPEEEDDGLDESEEDD